MLHPFEAHGLGQSPFHYAGFQVMVTKEGQPSGTCNYCFTGIKYAAIIQSSDGKRFVVGCECVRKLDHKSNAILTPMERDFKRFKRDEKLRKQREEWEANRAKQIAEREAEEAKQRLVNGGLTDWELEQKNKLIKEQEAIKFYSQKNEWILTRLSLKNGQFAADMYQRLQASDINNLSDNCKRIVAEIYAKSFGRSGSKKYEAALDEFYARTENN